MSQKTQRHSLFYANIRMMALMASLIIMLLSINSLQAQDGAEPAPTAEIVPSESPASEPLPTDIPTEAPTTVPLPTDVPTEAPTTVPLPTDVPTEAPLPTDTATDTPTEIPTEAATAIATEESPVVSSAPVFSFFNGTQFDNNAGTPLLFQASVSDDTGLVRVDATAAQGTISLTATDPAETAAPFNTLVNITYTANAVSGLDTVTLVAIDAEGQKTSATVTVNVIAPQPATEKPAATKEMLITYNPAASEEAIQSMLTGLGAVELSRIPQIGAMRVLLPDVMAMPSVAMTTLQSSGATLMAGVSSVEANGDYRLFVTPYTPNDPNFPSQWGLKQGPGGIFAEYAWNIALTRGTGVIVAVLDGGIDLQHPDMALQFVPGWDFVGDDNNPDNLVDDINTPLVDEAAKDDHGTHVAGIIAAKTHNLVGMSGLAFGAKIMPLKVCDPLKVDPEPACSMYYIAGAIVHAVDKGAKVINMSFGGTQKSSTVEAAINYALSRNVVVVAAAGNIGNGIVDGALVYPASYPGVISVASHDITGTRAADSNSNNMVDISAPGVGIQGLLPLQIGSYGSRDGTSMSTAYVSGVAALIIGAKIAITPSTVLDALICGAKDAGAPGYDNIYGYGHLQADLSLNWKGNSSSCVVTLPNDRFETPTVMAVAPFTSILPIDSRSVGVQTSDPSIICDAVAPSQTLWYSFRPTVSGNYQISTLGSSYAPVVGVFQGSAGQLTKIGCSSNAQSTLPLQALQTYYIVVGTNGAPVNGQLLQLRVHAAMPANTVLYQENALNIAYSGMWMRGLVTGSSLLYTQQTTDLNASAAFTFRGMSFDYIRTVGPAQGRILIYINNNPTPIEVDNRGAITKAAQSVNILVPGASTGQWNTVRIARDATVPGAIDLDAIKTYDFEGNLGKVLTPIITKVDDRSLQLSYTNGSTSDWAIPTAPTTVAYLGTLKQTNDPTAFVTFRTSGSAITIFRMTGPTGFAPIQVIIDNGTPITIVNTAPTTAVRSYTLDGLVAMPHVVEIRKIGTAVDGLIVQLDAIQSLTMVNLLAATTYDDRAGTALAYRGSWTDTNAVAGAFGLTTRTLTAETEVSFKFAGNDLCVGYRQPTGTLDVYIDATLVGTIPASVGVGFNKWCLDANAQKLVVDNTHYARLVVPVGNTFALDYVRSQRYNTLTPVRALVPETDASFRYSALTAWQTRTTTAKSIGGYLPQGSTLRATTTENTSITFYMSGTGFILYTGVGQNKACWVITVDGVVYQPETGVNGVNLLDLWRYRPLGFGVTGFAPGLHRVVLTADTKCSSIGAPFPSNFEVDFDGIRVFP